MIRRIVVGTFVALVVLAVAGVAYQAIATARDRAMFPPPGRLVDVGDHRLHVYCTGSGSPTVILDSLGDGTSAIWAWIQPAVADLTQTCAYDRAGFGWSEPSAAPADAAHAATDLESLLANAAIPTPYVLVGHSFGTHVSRLFAAAHPDSVVGMVLIDPGKMHPDPRLPPEEVADDAAATTFMTVAPWLARVGVMRLSGQGAALMSGLPPAARDAYAAKYSTTQHWVTLLRQNDAIEATSNQLRDLPMPANLPVVVLSAEAPMDAVRPAWTRVNAELAHQSARGEHRVIPGATHGGLATDEGPAHEVSEVIRQMVRAIREPVPTAG